MTRFQRHRLSALALLIALWTGCTESGRVGYQAPSPPVEAPLAGEVDPFIGTAADGMTFPGALVPWGMASPSPHTKLTTAADGFEGVFVNGGYRYGDPQIHGFGLTHLSGVGCPDLGLPVVAPTSGATPTGFDAYGSAYRTEVAYAGYYGVELSDMETVAEMTATPRTAVFRFWFPQDKPANITVDAARGVSWIRNQGDLEVVGPNEIAGSAAFGEFCVEGGGGRLYFVARADHAADSVGVVEDGVVSDEVRATGDAMAFLHYETPPKEPVTLWVGLSWVSVEQARANLEAEQLPFVEARDAASVAWQQHLGRVEVAGGTDDDRVRFYTALYHALIHPSILSDVDGTYPIFSRDEIGQTSDGARYTVFSLWDTYRTLHPLVTLVYPETQLEFVKGMQDMTLHANAPPKWELISDEVQPMVGDPALIVFADSDMKGLTSFDVGAVYDVMRDAAERESHRPGDTEYLDLGFVPMERADTVWGPVSTTLEYAFADWALAQLAEALGRDSDVPGLLERGQSYRGFYDDETGTLRPRNADGAFLEPFDPDAAEGSAPLRLGGPGYVEGTAWQYAFFVQHDVEGLIALHGEQAFVDRLTWVFHTDRFALWNEPDMAYPYLFTFVPGAEHNTQREVRSAMERFFGRGPDGLPGNDDAGALSAWFVFSAMGFYPVTPGLPEYRIGSPLFDRITLHLSPNHHEGETFVVEADGNGPDNIFVKSAMLDEEPLLTPVLSHQAITGGGKLRLQMSPTP
ncbi:MAG: glycoside hydrolase family 92 protein [Deltaproteobacteria bacterium]|nr:MAG: glycoside hydrolase family 92 protein [Deltaproteobacteria bacterium]